MSTFTPELERAFDAERAESLRTRSRWIWGGAALVWLVSLLWFDPAVFPSRSSMWLLRGPELALAVGLLVWLRRPRTRRAIEGWTLVVGAFISVMSSAALLVIPHEKLPAKVASLALSVAAILALGGFSWPVTLGATAVLSLSLLVLQVMGEGQLLLLTATAFGFSFGMLVALAAARERLMRAEFFSRRALVDANERLLREDEIRRRLFVNLSHDFRTPLTVIQGEAALLRGQHTGEQEAALERIEGNAQSLADLTEQLLDLARLDAGQMPLRSRRCDVGEVVREVVALLAPNRATLALTARVEEAAPVATVDPGHLRRILFNLVANSLRHARSAVELRVQRADERIVVDVLDDGEGVAPERRKAIFERFVTFDEGLGTTSGIGLPLARELAVLNGGSLALVDPAPRTTFRLELLASAGPADVSHRSAPAFPVARRPTTSRPPPSAAMPGVLIVEDNPDMASLLSRVLQGTFRIDAVSTVSEALERLKVSQPQAILSDVMLPDGTGYDLLTALRTGQGAEAPPVLLVSALSEVEQRVRGLAAGADDYIAKPFAPDELRSRVVAAVDRAEQRRRALDQQRDSLLMEIHDGVSASLSRAAILLDVHTATHEPEPALDSVLDAIRDGLDEVRAINSILSPQPCDWSALVADVRRATSDTCAAASIAFDFEADASDPLAAVPVAVAHTLRRVAREVTTNVLKHARATTLTCRMRATDGWSIHLEDDGRGLPTTPRGGQGLSIMRRRVTRLGGSFASGNRPEGGAFFSVTIPRLS